jgi:hypothetical protein
MASAKRVARRVAKAVKPTLLTPSQEIMAVIKSANSDLKGMLEGSDSYVGLHMVKRRSESAAGKQLIRNTRKGVDAAIKAIEDQANEA